MECRIAVPEHLDAVLKLQSRYHIKTIRDQDKSDGFVTTLFTRSQLKNLILEEQGLFVLIDLGEVVGYVMAGSWKYWKAWPMFQHMINGLGNLHYIGYRLSETNSCQYGPICIDTEYRGSGALEILFEFARIHMSRRFPILITFVNKSNPRSVAAHIRKLGLDTLLEFGYNGNQYLELAYDTSKILKVRG